MCLKKKKKEEKDKMTFRKRNKTKFSLEIAFSKKWKAIVCKLRKPANF